MLIDTHCHINMMVKRPFDILLTPQEIALAETIVQEAHQRTVNYIINVGTSVIESENCVTLARNYDAIFAVIGIHPNDLTDNWQKELKTLELMLVDKEKNKIVGIGECGMDFHYPDYNKQRQQDAFRAQIDIALEHNLGLVVHTRDAAQETLYVLEEYKGQIKRGIIHCFSENKDFADTVMDWGFCIGIGGIITYPKNNYLRDIVKTMDLKHLVLETDAPFLPVQEMRGKQNHPRYINEIAHYIANLRNEPLENISVITTHNAKKIFMLA